MIIICDSSPLIALSVIDQLDLLDKLFGEVYVPMSVFSEVAFATKPEANRIELWAKGKVVSATNEPLKQSFSMMLDEGESEAMALYFEKNADYLLLDEKKGRKIATYNHINVVGSLGILLLSKRKGLISLVAPLLNILQQSYIRISDELYHKTLQLAGE